MDFKCCCYTWNGLPLFSPVPPIFSRCGSYWIYIGLSLYEQSVTLQCEVQTTYYISLPICWCQRPCSLCLSKCIWHECYGSHTVSDQAGELTSASMFLKVFQTLAPKLCDYCIFFWIGISQWRYEESYGEFSSCSTAMNIRNIVFRSCFFTLSLHTQ